VRHFDIENIHTADLLNGTIDAITGAMQEAFKDLEGSSDAPLVIETDSRGYDEPQASDIAAGWAHEMLELGEASTLSTRFERVWAQRPPMEMTLLRSPLTCRPSLAVVSRGEVSAAVPRHAACNRLLTFGHFRPLGQSPRISTKPPFATSII
jgi:hypothetical protein